MVPEKKYCSTEHEKSGDVGLGTIHILLRKPMSSYWNLGGKKAGTRASG